MTVIDPITRIPTDSSRWLIIAIERDRRVSRGSGSILESLVHALQERGKVVVACNPRGRGIVAGVDECASMSEALERCENELLRTFLLPTE